MLRRTGGASRPTQLLPCGKAMRALVAAADWPQFWAGAEAQSAGRPDASKRLACRQVSPVSSERWRLFESCRALVYALEASSGAA